MTSRASVDDRRLRPPRLETAIPRPSTAPHTGTPSALRHATPPQLQTTPEDNVTEIPSTKQAGQQGFVLTDPVAFRYLEEDPSTTVLERRRELRGYECYIVEQWTTSRTHPTSVITTYTGDPAHTVMVGVLSVPTDESTWSPRLRVYFKALNQYHARRRETELGVLMVTNLSGFPSSLTVIPVPDGDLRKHRFDFVVNENLKRLGCSGRVSLTLTPPSPATIAKFHQLYRTSDKNDGYKSVIELVKLCQSALMLFDKLEIDYADGLLCDVTERAINDWWVEIGGEQYNLEPHDGILGPTTAAGLLGLLMGARNRLHAVGAPVAKDPFDVEAMKRGISHFQKQQRVIRTRRLDRRTLERLQRATQKAADHEGWTVPKVLKNTAAELSGKGGEMVMDAVGRRDRAGIAEIETCDIERFAQLVYGERCKWLWLGKPMKRKSMSSSARAGDHQPAHNHPQERMGAGEGPGMNRNLVFKQDDHGGFGWKARKSVASADGVVPMVGGGGGHRDSFDDMRSPVAAHTSLEDGGDTDEDESTRGFAVFKRASGLKNEAKSGLGKFRGAVGLKGHQPKGSLGADDSPTTPIDDTAVVKSSRRPLFRRVHSSPLSSPNSPDAPSQSHRLDAALADQRKRVATAAAPERARDAPGHTGVPLPASIGPAGSKESLAPPSFTDKAQQQQQQQQQQGSSEAADKRADSSDPPSGTVTAADLSIAGSIYHGVDLDDVLPTGLETGHDVGVRLRRTLSLSHVVTVTLQKRSEDAYPRHLSFSLAEESVLTWTDVADEDDDNEAGGGGAYPNDPKAQLADEDLRAKQATHLRLVIHELRTSTADWTARQLRVLDTEVLQQLDRDQADLDNMHDPHIEHVNYLQTHGEGVLREQRERLEEGGKEIEAVAAKLEYEIAGLRSRVEDVEAGVGDFGMGVGRVEDRVREMERDGVGGRGWGCVVM
ncbi:hypothetical protein LTR36_010380 [Oleoguttula mirabilis]|uniref:STB6-like N-terminal domain-containing protein n=1 Tax=Oleoguttula mirabilis TaxID=1507867 RepID=A0AAV9J4H5_9PEZI|nr:hypothetical protein LTR36_010380 [Oleoguttula mirabilis]